MPSMPSWRCGPCTASTAWAKTDAMLPGGSMTRPGVVNKATRGAGRHAAVLTGGRETAKRTARRIADEPRRGQSEAFFLRAGAPHHHAPPAGDHGRAVRRSVAARQDRAPDRWPDGCRSLLDLSQAAGRLA